MSESSLPPRSTSLAPAEALEVLAEAVRVLAAADPQRSGVAELGGQLVELQSLLDAADGVASWWTKAFADGGGPDDAGSPTLAAWMRRELRLTPVEARRRAKAAYVLDLFPETRVALFAGNIHRQHLDVIAHAVHQLGPRVYGEFESILLDVARECDADSVRQAVTRIRDTLDPDAADAAYVRALEKRDVTVTPLGEGFVLGGFLPPDTGAMFKEVLYAAAKPESADDDRTPGQRRVDGLGELCRSVLDHGLPTDRGLRPHLFVTVDADRLEAVTTGADVSGTLPASLAGFGDINDTLLSRLACECAMTPIAVDRSGEQPSVLGVGRTARLASLKQRQAIHVQQGGTCANPGCDRTHLEIHHRIPWSVSRRTELAELGGYCTRCHHLIHQGLLIVTPDGAGGWVHRTRRSQRLVDRRRRYASATTRFVQHVMLGGVAYAREQHQRWREGQPYRPPPSGAFASPSASP